MTLSLTPLYLAIAAACLAAPTWSSAQTSAVDLAREAATERLGGAVPAEQLAVSATYVDETRGITYVYLRQELDGVPIEGAVATVALKGGEVRALSEDFLRDARARVGGGGRAISAVQAVATAAAELGHAYAPREVSRRTVGNGAAVAEYGRPDFALDPIVAGETYRLTDDRLRRVVAVRIHLRRGDLLRVLVDAQTGEVLARENLTHHCRFAAGYNARPATDDCAPDDAVGTPPPSLADGSTAALPAAAIDGSSYRVFPFPAESPSHGEHAVVEAPADSLASPFGWHDTDGVAGPEYTITRGNNAHAYVDAADEDDPSAPEPDGGAGLAFLPAYDADAEAGELDAAATVNLFYATNYMHDFAYRYGFDEAAGNFQDTNYTGEGAGGDEVLAQAQDGAATNETADGPDEEHVNNATFSSADDGSRGRMQMYLWDRSNQPNPIRAVGPTDLAGKTYGEFTNPDDGGEWGVGVHVDAETDITAGVLDVQDGVFGGSSVDGCEPLTNADDLAGKIALVDRGLCQFGTKALNAQNAGAVAVIVCNFRDEAQGMGGGSDGGEVTIPVFMLSRSGCRALRTDAIREPDFALRIGQPEDDPVTYLSGAFDNGIIAHEYAHGISTRLTGGPAQSDCLRNDEQMGEGWSDFFSLVTTVRPGDDGALTRGIGTFVNREPTDGPGIRPFPYSTDMAVNPVTYDDVADTLRFSVPHGLGSVWASMLWDVYWDMVDRHGFDDDLAAGSGGNNMAVELVVTGLKLQPCSPGFVDGRDAILEADELLNDGANADLLWRAFARRGLGVDAEQGAADDRMDGVAGFELPTAILDESRLSKVATPTVEAGGRVDVTLEYVNWRADSVEAVSLTDELPAGTTLIPSSVEGEYEVSGDVLAFPLDAPARGDTVVFRYAYVAPAIGSRVSWYQPLDATDEDDLFEQGNLEGQRALNAPEWDYAPGGLNDTRAWYIEGSDTTTRPYIQLTEEAAFLVEGERPVFSFYHRYSMNTLTEAGHLQLATADEPGWRSVRPEQLLRAGYDEDVDYGIFAIPDIEGFAGEREEFVRTLVDLSDYVGRRVRVRWLYGSEFDATEEGEDERWTFDELSVIDAVALNTAATLVVGDETVTARAADIGTFVSGEGVVPVRDPGTAATELRAFPNPTTGVFTLRGLTGEAGHLEVLSATGQVLLTRAMVPGAEYLELDLGRLQPGLLVVRVSADAGGVQLARVVLR